MSVFLEGPNASEIWQGPAGAGTAGDLDVVVAAGPSAIGSAELREAVARVAATMPSTAVRYEFLDAEGRQLGVHVRRGAEQALPEEWVPVVVPGAAYRPDAHKAEAEAYRDRIGDRLLRPESVEESKKHLIHDDRQRADRVLALTHRSPLLDVGCSDGTLTLEAVRRWQIQDAVGIDVAASALDEARRAMAADASLAGRVRFVESFIESLDFPDGYFSTITACETLEHVGQGQLEGALANLLRMLRRGGDMVVTVPNRFPAEKYEQGGRARWSWPAHHQFYTRASLHAMLAPHFNRVQWMTHHEGDTPGTGIYLIVAALDRR